MHRFFVDPGFIDGDAVRLGGDLRHQVKDVLRLARGERFVVLDNTGWEYEVLLSDITKDAVTGEVVRKSLSPAEPKTNIRLYQGLLKGDKFELVLQKGTELGVSSFVPVVFERSVASAGVSPAKMERWKRIVSEAAEQSSRGKLPELLPVMPFAGACRSAPGFRLLPWEEEALVSLRQALDSQMSKGGYSPQNISVFIGSEGGITPAEVELAVIQGVVPVTLGPRILRAETAALAVVTAVLFHLGDMESVASSLRK